MILIFILDAEVMDQGQGQKPFVFHVFETVL